MKSVVLSLLAILTAGSVMAVDKADLDARVFALTAKFEQLQQQPDKRIPTEILRKARGIVLLDRTKAGFIFGYQGGAGLAMVKDERRGHWSPVAFLTANKASLGLQIGAEQDFFVILLMSTNASRVFTDPNFEFGGEARGTAGATSAGAAGSISTSERPVWVFSSRNGLYGGAAIKGGAIAPDEDANRVYYGQVLSMNDILFDKKVQPTPGATNLAAVLASCSKTQKP
jgi:lipid-binding SYLF domain-containing protein